MLHKKILSCALLFAITTHIEANYFTRITIPVARRALSRNIMNSATQSHDNVTRIRRITDKCFEALLAIEGNTARANRILLEEVPALEKELKNEIGDDLFEVIQEKCRQKAWDKFINQTI